VSIRGRAFIAGAYEHPGRRLPDVSVAQIHAEVALGAVADAGLSLDDIDGLFTGRDAPGAGGLSVADYLGLRGLRYLDSTESGGASPLYHVGHAAAAIAMGKCSIALVTLAGKARGSAFGGPPVPEDPFETIFGARPPLASYALAARRHMYEFGTTSEQLAAVKVAAATHAQHNPHAFLRKQLTVADVLASPMVADPLHRDDCCVVTDGGGAVGVVSPQVARTLPRRSVKVLGHGEAVRHSNGGKVDVTVTGAVTAGPRALEEAGVTVADIDYASLYDSFTIAVIEQLEDLGFCAKGRGGQFAADGELIAPHGRLPFNTDGGGLCNNHPTNRGGITKTIEAVRQLRQEANPGVQVPDCELALVSAIGGDLAARMRSAVLVLGRQDA
jgi:acetyl-CoA C-acetyltransferase